MPKTTDAPLYRIPFAHEVRGDYGESAGVSCPWCSTRQHPVGRCHEIVTCLCCGEIFALPEGYDHA